MKLRVAASGSARAASDESPAHPLLKRQVGLFGAGMIGLGSMVGTGVFVSIGLAAESAGPAVVLAIVVAAGVAVCNALSSAELAANLPVSGGAYEYGHRWLNSTLGFTAGWMFLCAKTASAATAALGFAGYALGFFGFADGAGRTVLALAATLLLTFLVLSGLRRSSYSNLAVVFLTLVSLLLFVLASAPAALARGSENLRPLFEPVADGSEPIAGFLRACALMFVAFTGYGRIATLAEEVHAPRRTIPAAIVFAMLVATGLYTAVGLTAVASVGAAAFAAATAQSAAPLEAIAKDLHRPLIASVIALGAVTAMLGVLLNLILGLSRVVLAMARRRDLPALFATISADTTTPFPAVILVGILIGGIVLVGDIKTAWSFSAFSVLIYYAISNLCAIRLGATEQLYPRVIPWLGLASCLFLALWVERGVWTAGVLLIAVGLIWHGTAQRLAKRGKTGSGSGPASTPMPAADGERSE